MSLVIRDVSWLWRTAYNCAVKGCTEWDNAEDRVPPLFDVSREVRLVLCPRLRCVPREWGLSYWKFTWKRRSRWMRRCICASCCHPLPLPRLGVRSNPTSPSAPLISRRLAVFAMRKLEPEMVDSDKVSFLTFPPLSLPGVINLSLHLSSNSQPVTFRPVKNDCARSWKKELLAPTTFPVSPKVLAYC